MNELHKYATFSVDLLGEPRKINSMFSMGRARIFYKGINRNRSIIDGEVAEKLASTIAGTPVIGTYNYETEDFEGHEPNASAYGFIPLNPNMEWVTASYNGKEREYLEVDVVIWDGRFEEAKSILTDEKSLSMELNPRTMRGSFERINDVTYYKVSYAEFAGITVLGDDVEPCFEDAQFITAYSNMVSAYALYVENLQENDKGGKDAMEEITEIVEPEVTAEEVVETEVEEVVEAEVVEETVEAEAVEETEVEPVVETEETTEAVVETVEEVEEPEVETVETEIVETIEDASDDALEFSKEEDEEACPECGKNPCVCKSACNEDKHSKEEDKEEDEEESNEEYVLKADYEALEQKYNEALNSLNKYTKKEKLEIIAKFSTKLESEELIERLTNEVDNYSIAEIKSELGNALVEQISAESEVAEETAGETNFSLNINLNDNSLGNTAWDLVKRHKESK